MLAALSRKHIAMAGRLGAARRSARNTPVAWLRVGCSEMHHWRKLEAASAARGQAPDWARRLRRAAALRSGTRDSTRLSSSRSFQGFLKMP